MKNDPIVRCMAFSSTSTRPTDCGTVALAVVSGLATPNRRHATADAVFTDAMAKVDLVAERFAARC